MTNYDELMMNAVDGTLLPSDKAVLEVYFIKYPDQRAAFEQVLAVDHMLKEAEPVAPPPTYFAERVMAQTRVTPIVKPIKRKTVAVLIAGNSLLLVCTWLMLLSFIGGVVWLGAQLPVMQPVLAFGRAITLSFEDVLRAIGSVTRAVFGQPLVWLFLAVAMCIVTAWFAVLARVFLPQHKLALVQL